MQNIIRKYKLHRFGISPDAYYNEIFDLIDTSFLNLDMYVREDDKNRYFYMNSDGIIVFEYEPDKYKGGLLKINMNYYDIFKILSQKYKLHDNNIRELLKEALDKLYNLNINIAYWGNIEFIEKPEKEYKNVNSQKI